MDRRFFLKALAAAPCVFGLSELFAQEAAPSPEWLRVALARMKERKLHGVVLIAPERIEPDQRLMGTALRELLEGDHAEAHELFLGGVFIAMTPSLAAASGILKADEKGNRVLLDPEGGRLALDATDLEVFEKPAVFTTSFEPFLFGKDRERLKARAEELEKSAPRELSAAFRDLGSEDIAVRERATGLMKAHAADYHPLFAWKRRIEPDAEVRFRLRSILENLYQGARKDAFGPRLPYGTRIPKFVEGGCGSMDELPEGEKELKDDRGMVACGMAVMDEPKVKLFLRFLTK